jgi:hypothetical protein
VGDAGLAKGVSAGPLTAARPGPQALHYSFSQFGTVTYVRVPPGPAPGPHPGRGVGLSAPSPRLDFTPGVHLDNTWFLLAAPSPRLDSVELVFPAARPSLICTCFTPDLHLIYT